MTWSLCVAHKVDYQEKQYAQGIIPTTYMRREGAPKERELLCGRIIDRPIRPLFPAGFYHEVQVFLWSHFSSRIHILNLSVELTFALLLPCFNFIGHGKCSILRWQSRSRCDGS